MHGRRWGVAEKKAQGTNDAGLERRDGPVICLLEMQECLHARAKMKFLENSCGLKWCCDLTQSTTPFSLRPRLTLRTQKYGPHRHLYCIQPVWLHPSASSSDHCASQEVCLHCAALVNEWWMTTTECMPAAVHAASTVITGLSCHITLNCHKMCSSSPNALFYYYCYCRVLRFSKRLSVFKMFMVRILKKIPQRPLRHKLFPTMNLQLNCDTDF